MKITDDNILDMIDTAGYGIAYWAVRGVVDQSARTFTVFQNEWEYEGEPIQTVTFDEIATAYEKLVAPDQKYVNREVHGYFINSYRDRDEDGIETGHIDATAADVLIQVAIWDEVVFG